MTIAEVRNRIKLHLRYPEALLTDEILQEAITRALETLNSITGGKPGRGNSVPDGARVLRQYFAKYMQETPIFYATSYPHPGWSAEGDPPGVYFYYVEDWTLENIDQDTNWILDKFIRLVSAYADIMIANTLYLSDSIEGLPFNLKSEDVISQANDIIENIKEEIQENWVIPSI